MLLSEAIEHCLEKSSECTECGREHLQLAKWLEELKALRLENESLKDEVKLLKEWKVLQLIRTVRVHK